MLSLFVCKKIAPSLDYNDARSLFLAYSPLRDIGLVGVTTESLASQRCFFVLGYNLLFLCGLVTNASQDSTGPRSGVCRPRF